MPSSAAGAVFGRMGSCHRIDSIGRSAHDAAVRDDLLLITARIEPGELRELRKPGELREPIAALAARDGRITWLGTAAEARRRCQTHGAATVLDLPVLDLPDAVALPGLVDAHAHPGWVGESAEIVDLHGARDPAEVIDRLRAAQRTPVVDAIDRWIRGAGWDEGQWGGPAGAGDLHAAFAPFEADPRPMLLHRVDRHAAWANAAARAAGGIDHRTADPVGGRIVRDASGQPTGLLYDNAIRPVTAAIPPPDAARRRRRMQGAIDRFTAAGLTAIHDLATSAADLETWREIAAAGPLPLRVALYLDGDDPALASRIAAGPVRGSVSERAMEPQIAGIKLFADGALGSRSAWLSAPYADDATTCGLPIVHGPALTARVLTLTAAGFAVAVHAIGDAAVRDAVDAFAAARAAGFAGPLRVEHAQIVDPATLARMASLDLFAGVQPSHAAADRSFARARLGDERLAWAYRLRSLAAAGATVLLGSDCPIAPLDPLATLAAALAGPEALDFDAALTAATLAPARALGTTTGDAPRGRLALGWAADVTVVARDPRATQFEGIDVLATIIAGRVISRRL